MWLSGLNFATTGARIKDADDQAKMLVSSQTNAFSQFHLLLQGRIIRIPGCVDADHCPVWNQRPLLCARCQIS